MLWGRGLCGVLQYALLNGNFLKVGRWPSVHLTSSVTNSPGHGSLLEVANPLTALNCLPGAHQFCSSGFQVVLKQQP